MLQPIKCCTDSISLGHTMQFRLEGPAGQLLEQGFQQGQKSAWPQTWLRMGTRECEVLVAVDQAHVLAAICSHAVHVPIRSAPEARWVA